MKKLIILLIFLPTLVLADDFLLVKNVWGKVNLIHSSNKKEPLKEYSVLKEGQSIEFVDKSSVIWFRDHNDNNFMVEFNDKNQYSFQDLIAFVDNNHFNNSSEKTFWQNALSLIKESSDDASVKISGMIISAPAGVSRNINSNIYELKKLFILEGVSFAFDFDDIVDLPLDYTNKIIQDYKIKIKDKSSKRILYDFVTDKKSFEIDVNNNQNSFGIYWTLEISNPNLPKNLVADLSSIYLDQDTRILLDELINKANEEITSDECFYQVILLEYLISKELYLNARYFLDNFRRNYNKPQLNRFLKIFQS